MAHYEMTEPAEGDKVLLIELQGRILVEQDNVMDLQSLDVSLSAPLADGFSFKMMFSDRLPLR